MCMYIRYVENINVQHSHLQYVCFILPQLKQLPVEIWSYEPAVAVLLLLLLQPLRSQQ